MVGGREIRLHALGQMQIIVRNSFDAGVLTRQGADLGWLRCSRGHTDTARSTLRREMLRARGDSFEGSLVVLPVQEAWRYPTEKGSATGREGSLRFRILLASFDEERNR